MRKIEWEPGTTNAVKERASALAWAANRRGSRVWHGKNVTQEITDYLVERDYSVDRSKVLTIMKKLVEVGYAYIHYGEGKKRIVEWGWMPDVDLATHTLPARVLEKPENHVVQEDTNPETAKVAKKAGFTMPPIPGATEAPPYRLDELDKLLKLWVEKDPETYANWIDAAIESLQTNT